MLKLLQEAYDCELQKNQFFEVPFGTQHPAVNAVFLWLFCKNIAPYLGLTKSDIAIPGIFCIVRWDGFFGTIGGKVDSDESLEVALQREALEEIGLDLTTLAAKCSPLISFDAQRYNSHVYQCEVSASQLYQIRDTASTINEKSRECCGYNVLHATRYRSTASNKQNGLNSFLAQQFIGASKAGLLKLILEKQLFTKQSVIY